MSQYIFARQQGLVPADSHVDHRALEKAFKLWQLRQHPDKVGRIQDDLYKDEAVQAWATKRFINMRAAVKAGLHGNNINVHPDPRNDLGGWERANPDLLESMAARQRARVVAAEVAEARALNAQRIAQARQRALDAQRIAQARQRALNEQAAEHARQRALNEQAAEHARQGAGKGQRWAGTPLERASADLRLAQQVEEAMKRERAIMDGIYAGQAKRRKHS